ncbi:uncharacterized protein LOC130789040 [Actinidia eriantha]|uniref:uncharacterized protein LOC130789040 n=1 Tax=Actinidia eriantha TaxID=165200 RepID=UPI0025894841|nr:uncharacterized protein LOC130789040 [Actinidia eriantha]
MAVSLPESCSSINVDKLVVPEINGALLMSLLEESQGDECDDGRLNDVIRSLEAEIDPKMMMDSHDLSMENIEWGSESEDCQSLDAGHIHGQDCTMSSDLDFNWVDMEMSPFSPSDEMTNWYMEPIDGIIEFGGEIRDYSEIYYGVPLEEHAFGSSLWQETYASEMYD